MKNSKKIMILSVLALAAVGLLVASRQVFAQEAAPTTTAETRSASTFLGKGEPRGMHTFGRLGETGLAAAAETLGMTSDELNTQLQAGATLADLADQAGVELQALRDAVEAAQLEATKAQISEAVSAGSMTQEEADWMLKGLEAGYTPGMGMNLTGRGNGSQVAQQAAAAEVLGITAQDLSNQLWAGRSLADIAEKAGVELTQVTDAMSQARSQAIRAQIEQAVADGTITQAQADWLLEGIEKGYDAAGFGGRGGFGAGMMGGRGTGHGMGGHGGRGDWDRSNAPADSSDSSASEGLQ